MNRRSFFGAAAGVAAAAPALAAVPHFPDGGFVAGAKLHTLKVAADTSALTDQFELIKGYSQSLDFERRICRHPYRPPAGETAKYIYRTGYPSIDALRSISGVHKQRMENRLEDRS
jgi:hypothetical protein